MVPTSQLTHWGKHTFFHVNLLFTVHAAGSEWKYMETLHKQIRSRFNKIPEDLNHSVEGVLLHLASPILADHLPGSCLCSGTFPRPALLRCFASELPRSLGLAPNFPSQKPGAQIFQRFPKAVSSLEKMPPLFSLLLKTILWFPIQQVRKRLIRRGIVYLGVKFMHQLCQSIRSLLLQCIIQALPFEITSTQQSSICSTHLGTSRVAERHHLQAIQSAQAQDQICLFSRGQVALLQSIFNCENVSTPVHTQLPFFLLIILFNFLSFNQLPLKDH